MKPGELFLGPCRFWLLWVAILAVLVAAGHMQLHVFDFALFLLVLVGAVAGSIGFVLATRRPGERVTRDPMGDET